MALDPRIILAGQAPDIMGAYGRGLGVGQAQNQIGRENALAQLYKTQGAQIVAGDPAAVNALAGMDPMAAMQVQVGRQDMAAQRQRMDMLTREEQRAIADRAAAMSAAERAAAAEQIESAVRMGLMVRTPQEWDQMVAQAGAPQLAGQFGNREALAARYMSMADVLKRATPEPVAPLSSEGKFYWDQRRGFIPEGEKPKSAGVTVNTGDNSNAFQKKADETAATRLGAIVEAGNGAQAFLGDMQALADLAAQINTGKGAELTAALGPWAQMFGVQIDGLTEMQAFEAIKDRLVPQMRPPGSGAASDFDARQFLSSLPSLGRTPEGNRIINDTLQALYQHRVMARSIAGQAFDGSMTWQEAERQIANLGNPYEAFNASRARIQAGAASAGPVEIDGFRIEAVD